MPQLAFNRFIIKTYLLAVCLISNTLWAASEQQQVYIDNCTSSVLGSAFTCDVMYTTSDTNSVLSGLGLRLHYNTNELEWLALESVLEEGFIASSSQAVSDDNDFDQDTNTTHFINTAWASFNKQWPSQSLPVKLYRVRLKLKTSVDDSSFLRFSAVDTSNTYIFSQTPLELINSVCCNHVDSDGDGLSNLIENTLGLNPHKKDSDDNGVDDGFEDTDSDGMSNIWEANNGLNPNNSSDADDDRDNNDESNLDEYLRVLASAVPSITPPADIVTASTGYKTLVDLGTATANDAIDGALTTTHNAGDRRFRPGRYTVTWSASNHQGRTSTSTQQVDILPRVDFGSDRDIREGQSLTIHAQLNGDAPSYPVTIPLVISGSAILDEDYSLSATNMTINSGHQGSLVINTTIDGTAEGTETLILALGTISANATIGGRDKMTINIKEVNSPPRLRLSIKQNNQKSQIVKLTGGIVTIQAITEDPDGDTLTYLWASSTLLDLNSDIDASTFEFDPNQVGEGQHSISLTINDGNGETVQKTIKLRIKDESGQNANLFLDENENGIPDLYDNFTLPHLLSSNGGTESPMETEPGLYLTTGDIGLDQESYQGRISKAQIESYLTNNGLGAYQEDNAHDLTNDIYDYKVKDLAIKGQSISIVFTLSTPIATNAKLRKYNETTGWADFVVDANNHYQTWNSTGGNCTFPDTDTITVTTGLKEGANCLQITIEDGGANDADGEANGEIDDPVAVATVKPSPNNSGSSGSNTTDTDDSQTTEDSSGNDDTTTDDDGTDNNTNTDDTTTDNTDINGGLFSTWLTLLFLYISIIQLANTHKRRRR